MPRFQMIAQFQESDFGGPDEIIALNDQLSAEVEPIVEFDGFDAGSGTVNFFMYGEDESSCVECLKSALKRRELLDRAIIALDGIDGEGYPKGEHRVVWPTNFAGQFDYM